jgi:hypothetical protein
MVAECALEGREEGIAAVFPRSRHRHTPFERVYSFAPLL